MNAWHRLCDDPRFLYFSFVFARGDVEKHGVEKRLSRCVLCRSMLVMIVLCIDGAICLRVLIQCHDIVGTRAMRVGNRGMHIGGTCAHAS